MQYSEAIERAFQELINKKHLYQSVKVDFEPCIEEEVREEFIRRKRGDLPLAKEAEVTIKQRLLAELHVKDWLFGADQEFSQFAFSLPPLRLLCSTCHDIEAFNFYGNWSAEETVSLNRTGEQVFWFPLQCQSCKNSVIVLLVHRIGRKITLVGRSEIEEVQVPPFIPKVQSRFYSQAIIAYQAGHALAGLFLLRTVIEQHMRAVTENSEKLRGDELCDAYAKPLPAALKQEFPSLKEIYKKLSDAMHAAKADNELFESERSEIERHFDALRLFKIHQ